MSTCKELQLAFILVVSFLVITRIKLSSKFDGSFPLEKLCSRLDSGCSIASGAMKVLEIFSEMKKRSSSKMHIRPVVTFSNHRESEIVMEKWSSDLVHLWPRML